MKQRLTVLCFLLLLGAGIAEGKLIAPEGAREVGDRAPIFSLVNDDGELVSYDRDFYGRHHLILTFFPAAFTPV